MSVFMVDGCAFENLPITSYKVKLHVVDNEGTGRTAAPGHPLFRSPAGTFYNLEITLGGAVIAGQGQEFARLVSLLESYGRQGYHSVTFATPSGVLTQNMYCTSAEFTLRKVARWGELFWQPLTLAFVAERAVIT